MSAVLERKLTWLITGASIVMMMVGIGFTLAYVLRTGDTRPILSHQAFIPAATLAFAVMGRLIVTRHPRHVIGWIILLAALFYGLTAVSAGLGAFASAQADASAQAGASAQAEAWAGVSLWMGWLGRWVWIPASALGLVFVLLLFPNGRLLSRRWAPVAWAAAVGLAGAVLSLALHPGSIPGWNISDPNPIGIAGAGPLLEATLNASGALVILGILAGMLAVVVRFRRSHGLERAQIKWVVYAAGVTFALGLLAGLLGMLVLSETAAYELQLLAQGLMDVGIAAAVTIGVLRHRLYDIDVVINRTLVYSALTASVAGVYLLVAGGLGLLLQARGSLALSLLGVGMVAIVAQPLHDRLQRGVNRMMYGERDDPYAVLSRLGQRLEATLAAEAVLPTLAETIAQALKLPYVAIALQGTEREPASIAAAVGHPAAIAARLPLSYQSEQVGELRIAARAAGEKFTPAEERLLGDIARQAGAAVHAVRLTTALQHSRERLVTAREEERRRIRRDLHDGLGPTLASQSYRLDALLDLIERDPQAARRQVAELKAQTQSTLKDIRRLVYALRPPALDELGLVAALQGQFTESANGLRIQMEVSPATLPPLTAAVEVAAYRIAAEAVTNAARHAQAQHCQVRLEAMPGELRLEVIDDGRGLPATVRAGVGMASMRERAAELGGLCVVEPNPGGGTRVLARLPIHNPPIEN